MFISGTGRAGTSFLMQLLTDLGLDTGYSKDAARNPSEIPDGENSRQYFKSARAGFERDPFDDTNPMFVKSPWLCDHLDALLDAGIKVGHLIVPLRDIADAAASRRFVQASDPDRVSENLVPGGLWGTEKYSDQEAVLAIKLGRLLESAVRNEVPTTLIAFPRFAQDADYTFRTLRFLFPLMPRRKFLHSFSSCSNPNLIHDFRSGKESAETE